MSGLLRNFITFLLGLSAYGSKTIGERFIARARVVKPGKQQIFTACDLFAVSEGEEKLVANGETLLCVI